MEELEPKRLYKTVDYNAGTSGNVFGPNLFNFYTYITMHVMIPELAFSFKHKPELV